MTKPTADQLVAALKTVNEKEVSDVDATLLAACLVEVQGMSVDAANVGGALLMFASRPIPWDRVDELLQELGDKGFAEPMSE